MATYRRAATRNTSASTTMSAEMTMPMRNRRVHELHDVEIRLRGQEVVHTQHQRRGEVREGPDEDQERAGDVARRRERQRDGQELLPAARADALRRLLQRRVDLGERVHDVERDHRKEMEGL